MNQRIEYPTLFARGETGAILEWEIIVEGNSFYTVTGQQGGKKITSENTVCIGKNTGKNNQTSPEEQAIAEAEAKWKKKVKSGYYEDLKEIDKPKFFQPQLAHKWEDYKDEVDWTNGVYISPKLDGLRCVITKNGAYSRNGNEFISFPHIKEKFKPLFDQYPDLILDGEIYCDLFKDNFNKIISLAKKTKPNQDDLDESEKYLAYWIFDCPSCPGGYHERYQFLHDIILKNYFNDKHIKLCIHKVVKSKQEIEEHLAKYISHGFEGLMINSYNGTYEQKRSKNILKYKLFQDTEAIVVDITEGTGNRSGKFGYATLRLSNGKTFTSSARGNDQDYINILKNKDKYIGKSATVRFQALTPDGIPRFPVIIQWAREDFE